MWEEERFLFFERYLYESERDDFDSNLNLTRQSCFQRRQSRYAHMPNFQKQELNYQVFFGIEKHDSNIKGRSHVEKRQLLKEDY